MHFEQIWQGHCQQGCSPLWDANQQYLYWLDSGQQALHQLHYPSLRHQSMQLPSTVRAICFYQPAGLIAVLDAAIVELDVQQQQIGAQHSFELGHEIQFNSAACDGAGRLWLTAKLATQTSASWLYRVDTDYALTVLDRKLNTAHGIAWSHDSSVMYLADAAARLIYQYDFNLQAGTLAARRVFARINESAGFPMALSVDSEGCLWCSHVDGWRLSRYLPDGRLDHVIDIPVQRPHGCCFGGPDMDRLFITSAANLTAAELEQHPTAGGVFALTTAVIGLLATSFKGYDD